MPRYKKEPIDLFDEDCAIERAWIETRPDGTEKIMCAMKIVAYLEGGTELMARGTFELHLKV
jgi:hypothetical protein